MPDVGVVRAFVDALMELFDAQEFEELMGGTKRPADIERASDNLAVFGVRIGLFREDATPLMQLKGQRALERLQARYPHVWEQVELGAVVGDA